MAAVACLAQATAVVSCPRSPNAFPWPASGFMLRLHFLYHPVDCASIPIPLYVPETSTVRSTKACICKALEVRVHALGACSALATSHIVPPCFPRCERCALCRLDQLTAGSSS